MHGDKSARARRPRRASRIAIHRDVTRAESGIRGSACKRLQALQICRYRASNAHVAAESSRNREDGAQADLASSRSMAQIKSPY